MTTSLGDFNMPVPGSTFTGPAINEGYSLFGPGGTPTFDGSGVPGFSPGLPGIFGPGYDPSLGPGIPTDGDYAQNVIDPSAFQALMARLGGSLNGKTALGVSLLSPFAGLLTGGAGLLGRAFNTDSDITSGTSHQFNFTGNEPSSFGPTGSPVNVDPLANIIGAQGPSSGLDILGGLGIPGFSGPGAVPGPAVDVPLPGGAIPPAGTDTGTTDPIATDPDSLSSLIAGMFGDTAGLRDTIIGQAQDVLEGRTDPSQSPAFVPAREGIEDAFGAAREAVISQLPRGGQLFEGLKDVEMGKARATSDILNNILADERKRAVQTGLGFSIPALGALQGIRGQDVAKEAAAEGLAFQLKQFEQMQSNELYSGLGMFLGGGFLDGGGGGLFDGLFK